MCYNMPDYILPALNYDQPLDQFMNIQQTLSAPDAAQYDGYIEVADIPFPATNANKLFTIHSDSLDVGGEGGSEGGGEIDFSIRLASADEVAANWPDIDLSTRIVIGGAARWESPLTVAYNYVRQLVKTFMGHTTLVDTLSNEAAMRQNVTDMDPILNAGVRGKLGSPGMSVYIGQGGGLPTAPNIVATQLFTQKYGTPGTRDWLAAFIPDWTNLQEDFSFGGQYHIPFTFNPGDKLIFGVTYSRAPTRNELETHLGGIVKTDASLAQNYKVTLLIT